nr:winged helix-turn-helix domain-containing protein [Sphingomonas naasensis]
MGDLRIDPVERRVEREGRAIALLPREYALLLHLARSAGRSIAREELLAAVWGLRFDPGTNVVEVHVSRLRAKLDRGFAAPMLVTDKGRGYRLIARADPQP